MSTRSACLCLQYNVVILEGVTLLWLYYVSSHRQSRSGSRRPRADPDECPREGGDGGGGSESRRLVHQLSDKRSQRLLAARESHTASAAAGGLQVSLVSLTKRN